VPTPERFAVHKMIVAMRRRLTLRPPWASPPPADDLTLAQQQVGCAARQKSTLAGPSWVTTGKAFAASFRKTKQCR
jgi:hypothetical protein